MGDETNEPSATEERRPADFDYSAYDPEHVKTLQRVDAFPTEYREKWDEFIDLLNEATEHVFGERGASVVVGVQWGEMGKDDGTLPPVVATSNLPPCVALNAADDVVTFLEAQHEDMHRQRGDIPPGGPGDPAALLASLFGEDGPPVGPLDPSEVPEAIRAQVAKFAEQLGVPVEDIKFMGAADMTDLTELPETDEPER